MTFPRLTRPLLAAALLGLAGASHGAITVSSATTASAFKALVSGSSDNLNDLSVSAGSTFADLGSTGLARSAGALAYTLGSTTLSSTDSSLWVVPIAGAIGVGTGYYADSLVFSGFSPDVRAFGGSFFGTSLALGEVVSGALTLTAIDVNGVSMSQNVAGNSASAFIGIISDAALASVAVKLASATATTTFASADNLVLSAVPEPSSYALLAGGLLALGLMARRRAR